MSSRFVLPYAIAFDTLGAIAPGAKLYFYASGTTTPQDTYSDEGLSVPNANPVVANAAGRFGSIFLLPEPYKAALYTEDDVLVWTADPVRDPDDGDHVLANVVYDDISAAAANRTLIHEKAAIAAATKRPLVFSRGGVVYVDNELRFTQDGLRVLCPGATPWITLSQSTSVGAVVVIGDLWTPREARDIIVQGLGVDAAYFGWLRGNTYGENGFGFGRAADCMTIDCAVRRAVRGTGPAGSGGIGTGGKAFHADGHVRNCRHIRPRVERSHLGVAGSGYNAGRVDGYKVEGAFIETSDCAVYLGQHDTPPARRLDVTGMEITGMIAKDTGAEFILERWAATAGSTTGCTLAADWPTGLVAAGLEIESGGELRQAATIVGAVITWTTPLSVAIAPGDTVICRWREPTAHVRWDYIAPPTLAALGGGANTITLAVGDLGAEESAVGWITQQGETVAILSADATTGIATMAANWATPPIATTPYVRTSASYVKIDPAVDEAGTVSFPSPWVGRVIVYGSGSTQQRRRAIGHASGVLTLDRPLTILPVAGVEVRASDIKGIVHTDRMSAVRVQGRAIQSADFGEPVACVVRPSTLARSIIEIEFEGDADHLVLSEASSRAGIGQVHVTDDVDIKIWHRRGWSGPAVDARTGRSDYLGMRVQAVLAGLKGDQPIRSGTLRSAVATHTIAGITGADVTLDGTAYAIATLYAGWSVSNTTRGNRRYSLSYSSGRVLGFSSPPSGWQIGDTVELTGPAARLDAGASSSDGSASGYLGLSLRAMSTTPQLGDESRRIIAYFGTPQIALFAQTFPAASAGTLFELHDGLMLGPGARVDPLKLHFTFPDLNNRTVEGQASFVSILTASDLAVAADRQEGARAFSGLTIARGGSGPALAATGPIAIAIAGSNALTMGSTGLIAPVSWQKPIKTDAGFFWQRATTGLLAFKAGAVVPSSDTDGGVVGGGRKSETIYWPMMVSRASNGAAPGSVELSTSKRNLKSYDFDTTAIEMIQFVWKPPKRWDGLGPTLQFVWSHAATVTNFGVQWAVRAAARSDGDALDLAYGTTTTVDDTGGTTDVQYTTAETAAISIAGTPVAGDVVSFEVYRNVGAAIDNLGIDARLHQVVLHWNATRGDDA